MKKIFTMILLLVISKSFATTYYVSTIGDDTYNGTSLSTPFLTIAKALTKAVAGDIVYIRRGTYTLTARLNITKIGTAANKIILSAYPVDLTSAYPADGRPVLDFSALAVGSSSQGIQAKNTAYWNIYGLKIKGAGDNGMLVDNCNFFKIEYCDFYRSRDAGFQIRNLSHHCLILNCDSYENADLGTGTTTNGGNADGFAPKLDLGDSIIFRGCRAWLNSDDGWDGYLKATESGVPDGMTTILENCWTWRNGYYWLNGTTTAAQNGNGFKLGGSANKDQAHNFIMVKCLSFYNKAKGFDQNNNAGSIELYNCTANKNGDNDFGLNSSGVTYAATSKFIVKNCNSLGTKSTSFRSATIKSNNNFSIATTSTNYTSIDTTGVSGIRKMDGSLPDIGYMHLANGSSLINAGITLPNVSYYGNLGVPFYETAPDIGCFESNYSLPVSITTYQISIVNNTTGLEKLAIKSVFTTATEINTSHFNILRSTNEKDFEIIGTMLAKGASTYNFIDNNLPTFNLLNNKSIIYYRLEIVGKDGSKQYSDIKTISLDNKQQTNSLIVFPNPSKNITTLVINVPYKTKTLGNVYSNLGVCVHSFINEILPQGVYSKNIDMSNLPSGNYVVKILFDNGTSENKIIIKE